MLALSLRVFDALEPKFTPFKFVLCVDIDLASEGCVYFLNFCTMRQPEKWEQFPLHQTWVPLM